MHGLAKKARAEGMTLALLSFINTYIFGPALPLVVFASGLYYSLRLRFFHLRRPQALLEAIMHTGDKGTSPFKAMTVALAGTLGVGNIAGVSAAIASGGAGAVFWLWASALFAMPIKYAETVLAVGHRRVIHEGGKRRNTGGAYIYMSDGGHRRIALIFALLCILTSFGMGGIVQANAIAVSLNSGFSLSPHICGVVFAVLTFGTICGGFERISDFTYLAVPAFCALYVAVSLYIIFANVGALPSVLCRIFSEAFSLRSAGSGILGYTMMRAMRFGVARGILSNEAGSGTSVSAHAASDANTPCEQGIFGILEVFVDTIVLCSMTAFVILLADNVESGEAAMVNAIHAYGRFIGSIAPGFISVSVTFFAFATIICWSVYGVEAIRFILSDYMPRMPIKRARRVYFVVYSLSVLVGCVISGELMWELTDAATAIMTLINTGYLIGSASEVVAESRMMLGGSE